MTSFEKAEESNWLTPDDWQEVSNRSILRVQVISDELKERLNGLPLFKDENENGRIEKILFAARRYDQHENPTLPWYQFRLCQGYAFPPEVLEWLAESDNKEKFRPLFEAAEKCSRTRARFETFAERIGRSDRSDFEQFVIALAILPYRGVLLDLFEEFFFPNRSFGNSPRHTCSYFSGPTSSFSMEGFDGFSLKEVNPPNGNPQGPMKFPEYIGSFHESLTKIFKEFILEFTRGQIPGSIVNRCDVDSTHKSSNQDPSLHGFVVPAYDDFREGKWLGGMHGWAVFFFNRDNRNVFFKGERSATEEKDREDEDKEDKDRTFSWHAFTQLMRTYSRRIREAHMLDLLEEYAELPHQPEPKNYLAEELHNLTGWQHDSSKAPESELTIPFEARGERIVVPVKPLTGTLWEDPGRFPDGTVRLCKLFVDGLKLAEAQRGVGQKAGILASAHDYSKDIGSVLLRLTDFKKDLDRSQKTIKERASELSICPEPAARIGSSILDELRNWTVPRFDWFSGVRFTNAHLETQTRRILVSEPAECLASLEGGTLRDIYEIVRVLVWHPIPFEKLKKKESEFTKFAPEKLNLPSTWWTLFTFDLDPCNQSRAFHNRLGERLRGLILEEKIRQSDFARRFNIPRINPGTSIDDPSSILWPDTDWSRWRPLNGLLPLFVFSMRFAFQCAWAKTLLEEPSNPIGIKITPSAPKDRSYELSIQFPSPLATPTNEVGDLPYHGEWLSQIRHYTESQTAPWKVDAGMSDTADVTHEERSGLCWILISASI